MILSDLLACIPDAKCVGNPRVEISGIAHDSRDVTPGCLFVCLVGSKHDGHDYVHEAIQRGAHAVCVQADRADALHNLAPLLAVPDTRKALPHLAAAVHGHPSRELRLVGVTGTNGKTTTTQLIAAILQAGGLTSGVIGTLGARIGERELPSAHTTPEADHLQALLREMRAGGAQAVAMEVSSHALAQHRTDACAFDCAVFTNLTQDHLDFHKDMEDYYAAKRRLFTDYAEWSPEGFVSVINVDDQWGRRLSGEASGRLLTYGVLNDADVSAKAIDARADSIRFRAKCPGGDFEARLPFGGQFQVYNALAAICAAVGMGVEAECIAAGLAAARPVPGRFEPVSNDRGFSVIVDYAHTPDGLANLLRAARSLKPRRILLVFGCGGDRDRGKRPQMGRLAAECADVAIVTSDNPRTEDPRAIIQDILAGMSGGAANLIVESDRREAIRRAIELAQEGDIVLIAGKGHETYQIVGSERLPFDDRQVAREVLGRAIAGNA